MKALLIDDTHPYLEEALERGGVELIRDFERPLDAFLPSYFTVDAIVIRSRMRIDAEFLALFPNLKVIGRLGAGLENIDTAEAQRLGIACERVPEGNARAVAEHALGMLLSLLNHLPRVHKEIGQGLWKREPNKGRELQALQVGIIGYGIMGSEFAGLLAALGVQVLAHDLYKTGFGSGSIHEVGLDELFERADVVSLHLPLTAETRGYANAEFFSSFHKPIHVLNTARGPILETRALVHALEQGKVLSAGLDVLEYEKSSFTSLFESDLPETLKALLQRDNVLLSPHIAGWTKESFEKMGRGLAEKIVLHLGTP